MTTRILYLLAVVAVGWAVTVGLRSLPFLLFSRHRGELPRWVASFGAIASPIIIAALIVYSYAGLEWKTPWPYLAGLLTIGLQLIMKNPLLSILAGTGLYMCVLNSGCASKPIIQLDAENSSIRFSDYGLYVGEDPVKPIEVYRMLQDNDIPRDRVIPIQMIEGTTDYSQGQALLRLLVNGGYRRAIIVSEQKAEAVNMGKRKKPEPPKPAVKAPKKIRYKGARD